MPLGKFSTEVGTPYWSTGPAKNQNNQYGLLKKKKKTVPPYKLPKRSCLDADSDGNIEVVTTFPSFLILESTEEKPITKLFSFTIDFFQKILTPKTIKTTCNSNLIVEVTKKKYGELLKMTTPPQL